jgi:hypothetical protein
MQLIYRGNIFDYNLSGSNNSGISGFKANQAATRRNNQQSARLTYRGATYSVTPDDKSVDNNTVQTPHTLTYRRATYVVNGSH